MELFKLQFTGLWVLFFCLVALRSSSAWNLNEKVPPTSPTNTQIPSRKPKSFLQLPDRKNKFKRFIYLKHLLQLKCLSEICRKMQSKPPGQQKSEGIKKQISVVRNNSDKIYDQSLLLSNTRQQLNDSPHRSKYPANGRIILLPSNYYLSQPIPQRNSSYPGKPRQKERPTNQQNYKIVNPREPSQNEGSHPPEEKLINENKKVFTNNDQNSGASTSPDDKFQAPEEFDVMRLTTATSHSFRLETTPNSLGQYEVREIIEENKTNNFINFTTSNAVAKNVFSEDVKKNMDNVTTSKPNNEINTTATTPHFKITSSTHRSRDFYEKSDEVQLQVNREELTKHLRVRPSQSSNSWKPSTLAPRKTDEQNVNSGHKMDSTLENLRGVPHNSLNTFISDYFAQSDFYDDLEHKTTTTTTTTIQKSGSRILFPSTKSLVTGIIPQQTTATVSKQPLTLSVAPIEIQTKTTSKEYLTTKLEDLPEQPRDSRNYRVNTSTPPNTAETVQYYTGTINEAELTTPNFEEYLDYPLIFDLLKTVMTDSKKDHEKNSRKMHFGQEPRKTTKPALHNQLSDADDIEQRRSDILIDENFDDYIDDEHQFSALNYLEKLKQNDSNLTTDSIVPLIPEIINDLRENKISDDNVAILSDAFGKYWKTVLFLANNTNLDMLPLLKMRNEKDLKNVLQSLALEKLLTTTTEKLESEISSHFYFDFYNYMEMYDNLFKEIQDRKDHSMNSVKKRI